MATKDTSLLAVVSRVLAFLASVAYPIGLFSILAAGIHIGTDRLDDLFFGVFSAIDAFIDSASAFCVRGVSMMFGASDQTIAEWTYRTADFIDMETKTTAARWTALVVELAADFVLALPVFLVKSDVSLGSLIVSLKSSVKDPTVIRLALPVAVMAAGTAGTFAVSREVQVLVHSSLTKIGMLADWASLASSLIGFVALTLVSWRLLVRVLAGSIELADLRSRNDAALSVSAGKRRLRGLIPALVTVPVALIALWSTPILGSIRALLWL